MIQVYTGNGKGKTTAALGLALRAAGADLKVFIAQFAKGKYCSELNSLKRIKNIRVEQFGRGCFIKKLPTPVDLKLAKRGLNKINRIIACRSFDMVILDEVNIALKLKLVALKDILDLIKKTPKKIELVLTGRCAPQEILKLADLVSEIRARKHYFQKNLKGRRGIEF